MTRDTQDTIGIILIIMVGLLVLNMMSCAPVKESLRTPITKEYPLHGKCWFFDRIEREIIGHSVCYKSHQIRYGLILQCTRRYGHKGKHHAHSDIECEAVWK